MKLLLTGGLGHIGSHLYTGLSDNNDVTVLDNFSNNFKNINRKNIIEGDIRDRKIVNTLANSNDMIIHLAAQINVSKSIEDPIFDSDNNINGTLNLLEASRKSNIKRFIYISSAAVYGVPIYLPIDEKHPTNPISPYGLSKLTGERYAMLYHDLYGLPVTCVRLFNVFGTFSSSDDYSGVITKFIDRVKNNQNPIIFGDGNQTRDFIYINDIVNIISKIIENDKTIGEIYNIGTGNPIKIVDLAKIIINIFDKNLEPEFFPSKIGDIQESYANIDKIRKIIEPDYSLEKGLYEMIRHIIN